MATIIDYSRGDEGESVGKVEDTGSFTTEDKLLRDYLENLVDGGVLIAVPNHENRGVKYNLGRVNPGEKGFAKAVLQSLPSPYYGDLEEMNKMPDYNIIEISDDSSTSPIRGKQGMNTVRMFTALASESSPPYRTPVDEEYANVEDEENLPDPSSAISSDSKSTNKGKIDIINLDKQDGSHVPSDEREYIDSPDEAPDSAPVYQGEEENVYFWPKEVEEENTEGVEYEPGINTEPLDLDVDDVWRPKSEFPWGINEAAEEASNRVLSRIEDKYGEETVSDVDSLLGQWREKGYFNIPAIWEGTAQYMGTPVPETIQETEESASIVDDAYFGLMDIIELSKNQARNDFGDQFQGYRAFRQDVWDEYVEETDEGYVVNPLILESWSIEKGPAEFHGEMIASKKYVIASKTLKADNVGFYGPFFLGGSNPSYLEMTMTRNGKYTIDKDNVEFYGEEKNVNKEVSVDKLPITSSDWMVREEEIEKYRVYIEHPSQAPDWADIEEGPQGGIYYEVGGTSEGQARLGQQEPEVEGGYYYTPIPEDLTIDDLNEGEQILFEDSLSGNTVAGTVESIMDRGDSGHIWVDSFEEDNNSLIITDNDDIQEDIKGFVQGVADRGGGEEEEEGRQTTLPGTEITADLVEESARERIVEEGMKETNNTYNKVGGFVAEMVSKDASTESIVKGTMSALADEFEGETSLVFRKSMDHTMHYSTLEDIEGFENDLSLTSGASRKFSEEAAEKFRNIEGIDVESVEAALVSWSSYARGKNTAPLWKLGEELTDNDTVIDHRDRTLDADISDEEIEAIENHYEYTQSILDDLLDEKDTVTLFRGLNGLKEAEDISDEDIERAISNNNNVGLHIPHQTIESWSTGIRTPMRFASEGGIILKREVPKENIISFFGSTDELLSFQSEFIVASEEEHEYDSEKILPPSMDPEEMLDTIRESYELVGEEEKKDDDVEYIDVPLKHNGYNWLREMVDNEEKSLTKYRVYVDSPGDVPDWATAEEGPQGGIYYEVHGTSEGQARLGRPASEAPANVPEHLNMDDIVEMKSMDDDVKEIRDKYGYIEGASEAGMYLGITDDGREMFIKDTDSIQGQGTIPHHMYADDVFDAIGAENVPDMHYNHEEQTVVMEKAGKNANRYYRMDEDAKSKAKRDSLLEAGVAKMLIGDVDISGNIILDEDGMFYAVDFDLAGNKEMGRTSNRDVLLSRLNRIAKNLEMEEITHDELVEEAEEVMSSVDIDEIEESMENREFPADAHEISNSKETILNTLKFYGGS